METFGLENIAPLWAGKIKEKKNLSQIFSPCIRDLKVLDLSVKACCIVGEAHGFDQAHSGCRSCLDYSIELWDWVYRGEGDEFDFREIKSKSFNDALKKFIKHFNKVHKE